MPLLIELELIQPHMAQKPVLRGEAECACVAREVSVEKGGMGERGCASRLGRVCVCGVRGPLCCGAPPQGLSNAPHDPGMCWKQFMMSLEDTWFVAAFHSNPMHDHNCTALRKFYTAQATAPASTRAATCALQA